LTDQTWDERYDQESDLSKEASLFLKKQLNELPRGMALDLAMGTGRNAIFLAENGYVVDSIDSSAVAVEKVRSFAQRKSLPIHAKQADFYFLERSLFPHIMKGLKQGGMLLFETYTIEQRKYGRPHNPAYLLKPNELLQSFIDLHIIYYHERIDKQKGSTKAIASLLAQKR
jgi:tellurite methyltransferase